MSLLVVQVQVDWLQIGSQWCVERCDNAHVDLIWRDHLQSAALNGELLPVEDVLDNCWNNDREANGPVRQGYEQIADGRLTAMGVRSRGG